MFTETLTAKTRESSSLRAINRQAAKQTPSTPRKQIKQAEIKKPQ
jgi:hypothetical protein